MLLLKRIGFGLFMVLAVTGAAWAYLRLKKSKKPKVEAISVLPDSCLVYLNTPDFFELNKKLNSQNLLVDKLKLFKDVGRFCGTLQTIDSLLGSSEVLRKEIHGSLLHVALYKNMSWLAAFNIKQLGDQQTVSEALAAVFHATRSEDSYTFRLGAVKQMYFTLSAGVALVSDSKATIDRALNSTLPKLYRNKFFMQFKSTLEENSPLNIYTDHQLYAGSAASQKLDLSAIFKGSSAGMIDLQPSQITVNGFASGDSTELLSALSNQQAAGTDFVSQLPSGTSSFTAYGFSDFYALQSRLEKHFQRSAAAYWKMVNDSALYNLENEFYQNAATCLVSFETQFPKQNFLLLDVNDTAKAAEHLRLMSDSLFSQSEALIYRLKESTALFAPLAKTVLHYAVMHDNYLFFSETPGGLFQWLDAIKSRQLMTENKSFAAYKSQNFPEAFNFLIYSTPSLANANSHPFFNDVAAPGTEPFQNFKHFSFFASNSASHFKFRWHLLNEAETTNKDPNVLWSLALDHPAAMKASVFTNHLSGENELLVQDEANVLYLVNAKGTVLWKKELNEKIASPVFVVDMFKNNRYQMLFNTQGALHLIDRNGNEVKGYPVKLPAPASAPLALFDYDSDKNYRLLIACENNTIYNYDLSATKHEGFAPVKTEGGISLPVQYVKVGQSDYLVAMDVEGRIYTFSRKGASRIGLKNRGIAHCQAFYVDATNNINSTFLVYADDKNGLISKISFSDKKEIVKLSADISNAQVSFALIDENRSMDMIFTKPDVLMAYDLNGNLLFEKSAGHDFSETGAYSDESRSVFYSLNADRSELLLMDQQKANETAYKASATPLICDLFHNNKKYLVITNGNRLNCLLLN